MRLFVLCLVPHEMEQWTILSPPTRIHLSHIELGWAFYLCPIPQSVYTIQRNGIGFISLLLFQVEMFEKKIRFLPRERDKTLEPPVMMTMKYQHKSRAVCFDFNLFSF